MNLFFLVGLPRSGKSTVAKNWAKDQRGVPRVIVCADDIRLAMGHRWNGHVEPFVHATKITMIKALLRHHDVLVDGTHTTESSIQQLLNIDPDAQPFIVATDTATCKYRAIQSDQSDLLFVIDRMYGQLIEIGYPDIQAMTSNIDAMRQYTTEQRISD